MTRVGDELAAFATFSWSAQESRSQERKTLLKEEEGEDEGTEGLSAQPSLSLSTDEQAAHVCVVVSLALPSVGLLKGSLDAL